MEIFEVFAGPLANVKSSMHGQDPLLTQQGQSTQPQVRMQSIWKTREQL